MNDIAGAAGTYWLAMVGDSAQAIVFRFFPPDIGDYAWEEIGLVEPTSYQALSDEEAEPWLSEIGMVVPEITLEPLSRRTV